MGGSVGSARSVEGQASVSMGGGAVGARSVEALKLEQLSKSSAQI